MFLCGLIQKAYASQTPSAPEYSYASAPPLDPPIIEVPRKNIQKLTEAGANVFVAGSHVFKSDNQIKTIKDLKALANS